MAMRKIATIVLLISLGFVYGQNLIGNAGLEDLTPAFWTPLNATMGGDVDVSATAKYGFSSFMISKASATTTEEGWMSDDNANLFWNNAGTGTFAVSVWYKTDGVNTSPANDDAKIGVVYTFNNASGTELATTTLWADQSAASTDWTELTGVVILSEAPEQVFVKQVMGKDATGTVYFDGIGCNTSDSWTMGVFNGGAEDVDGWMDWYGGNGNYTYVTDAEANTGTNSIVMAQPDTMTSMSELVYYSTPAPVEAGEWYKIGVWVKTEGVVDSSDWDRTYIMRDAIDQRVNLCYFFHTNADLNAGWDLVGGDKFVYVDQRDPSTGWTHYVVAEQAPEEATGISVRARFNNNTTGTAYFDDFSVEKMATSPGTGIIDVSANSGVPSDYVLARNYPNPFNPSTHIRFTCPSSDRVKLEIRNVLGQHVKTLVDSEMGKGNHEVIWNGDNTNGQPVASGVYIYSLVTNKGLFSQKMILIR
ncbi:MAG: T9SS type A sorting domain-containing protein [Candidatus Marinimicrobia bacterium]|nr:T9SS type A sorting domain-containing protein [Candidatus Neomarinimicrobiota bacterium]